jgi:phage baseplate assembly protein W
MNTNVAVPFGFDFSGRTAAVDDARHIRDLIESVLLTNPGERVNRPGFGCGVLQLLFAPANETLASTMKYLIEGALQQWLSDRIQVQDVTFVAHEGEVDITVSYVDLLTQQQGAARIGAPVVSL